MPLLQIYQPNSCTKIGVWHITEKQDFFEQHVSLKTDITHPHKRLQHLAGRLLLKTLFPAFPTELIAIADTKKPYLPNESHHFSISHCGNYAAAIVSTQNRVGVDIEMPTTKIERIQHKFLSSKEQDLLANTGASYLQALTMAWSAKEAMFKWYGLGQVDFKAHMHINSVLENDYNYLLNCSFLKTEQPVELLVQNYIFSEVSLAWVIK
jgi:phosphopantetheinyl transferase